MSLLGKRSAHPTVSWYIPAGLLNRSLKFELQWLLFLRSCCRTLLFLLRLMDLQSQGMLFNACVETILPGIDVVNDCPTPLESLPCF